MEYLDRIAKYTKIEESTIILTLIYIDRICDFRNIHLSIYNIHRMIIGALMLAVKYNEDDFYTNEFYAKVGGISLQEVNLLECETLKMIKHSLFVDEDFFNKYKLLKN